jgi:Putative abortive phage resistance protein AbiGi, antitoxin
MVRESYDVAVHSDFLIHWTGRDIDQQYNPTWADDHHRSRTSPEVVDLYLSRLKDIVTYGLWMTEEGEKKFAVGSTDITVPSIPKCCFTELKLSESRRHAQSYGRLGIGVKRPFLFRRLGRPLAYVGFGENNQDRFLKACASDLREKTLLNFFKPMNSETQYLTYDFYSESEWRILFFRELLERRVIIDPRDRKNAQAHAYFTLLGSEQQAKLKYLVPLDGWFSMVIYPSAQIKNAVRWKTENGIQAEITRLKAAPDHGNRVEGGNWPIEVDLDACRHF